MFGKENTKLGDQGKGVILVELVESKYDIKTHCRKFLKNYFKNKHKNKHNIWSLKKIRKGKPIKLFIMTIHKYVF